MSDGTDKSRRLTRASATAALVAVAIGVVAVLAVSRAERARVEPERVTPVITGSSPSQSASPGKDATSTATPAPTNFASAVADLERRGFNVRAVLEDGTPADPAKAAASDVVSMSPQPSDRLPPGTTIDVVVNCGAACATVSSVQCTYPRGISQPAVSASRIRPGDPIRLSGSASPGEPMVVALLEKGDVQVAGPFAKYLGAAKARPAPTCEYDIDLVIPTNVRPGRYSLIVLFDGKTPAGPAIAVEVLS